jgi:uncharacterized protein
MPAATQGSSAAPRAYHVLAKPTGAVCNLDCSYCFFLSKEELYPDSSFRMKEDVLEAYIRQVIETQRTPHVAIAWQGGEPTLMGRPFFEKAVGFVKKHLRSGMTVEHTIQTNGTLLDDEWCEFFKQNDFLVGLSLDGPEVMHDAFRVDKGGAPTFQKVLAAARLLQRHGVNFNVLSCVHAANADHPLEVYRFLRDELGTSFIQFIPIVERATPELLPLANRGWGNRHERRPLYVQEGNLVTERSVKPAQWGEFLIGVFDEWVRRDVGTVFVQMFDAALASWLGIENPMCVFNERCGTALALEHNGDLYSCDHFVEPRHLLGNIQKRHMREMVSGEQQRAFGNAKLEGLPAYCRSCDVRFACHGECPRNRFTTTPDGEPGLNYLCAGYMAFFRHVDRPMKMMADLVRKGRYADEVMQMLDAEP